MPESTTRLTKWLRNLWSRYKAYEEDRARQRAEAAAEAVNLVISIFSRLTPEDKQTIHKLLKLWSPND